MKTKKPMRPLLAAFVLLVGITSTDAALCSATAFVGTVSTCDCPVGTGPSGSYGSALPAGTYGGATAGASGAAKTSQLNKAKAALALCKDLLPGYKKANGNAVLPTACVIADGYCPGYKGAFFGNTQSVIVTTGFDGAFTTPVTGTYATKTGAGGLAFTQKTLPILCPANSGGVNTATVASGAGASSTGQVAPFTIDKCKVTDGFYIAVVSGAATATVSACPQFKVCATGTHAGSAVLTPVNCVTTNGVNDDLTPGGFFCPTKTYGALGTTLALSLSGITGEKVCGAGSGPMGTSATTCDVLAGFYGANSALSVAMTACPVGITGNGGADLVTACTSVAPGYEILTDIPAQTTPGAITTLTGGIKPCAGFNKFCLGTRAITFTGSSDALATYTAVAKSAVSTKCPTGTGNKGSGASSQGVNAVSYQTACLDLLENYSFKASQGGTTAINALVEVCAAGQYNCGGSTGLFVDYTLAANTLATTAGLTATGSALVTGTNTFAANIASGATGTVVKASCPGGSTNVAAGSNSLVASCVTVPGKYIDHSSLSTTATCPKDHYCPGGIAVGTAGGDLTCPTGSTGPTTSSVENSHISDCIVKDGFYISGAVNVPVPCLTANICAGGGPVGTAGGSVACPTDSTNTACVSASSTTVNLTPASQPISVDVAAPTSASPDVTVTNSVPSASSASTTAVSLVLMAVSAFVVAF